MALPPTGFNYDKSNTTPESAPAVDGVSVTGSGLQGDPLVSHAVAPADGVTAPASGTVNHLTKFIAVAPNAQIGDSQVTDNGADITIAATGDVQIQGGTVVVAGSAVGTLAGADVFVSASPGDLTMTADGSIALTGAGGGVGLAAPSGVIAITGNMYNVDGCSWGGTPVGFIFVDSTGTKNGGSTNTASSRSSLGVYTLIVAGGLVGETCFVLGCSAGLEATIFSYTPSAADGGGVWTITVNIFAAGVLADGDFTAVVFGPNF